jgi:hypothetical protein
MDFDNTNSNLSASGDLNLVSATNIIDLSDSRILVLPNGTTAQRPAATTANAGYVRFNTNESILESIVSYPAGSFASYAGVQFANVNQQKRFWVDEFLYGAQVAATGVGIYGDLGWSVTSSGTNTFLTSTSTIGHPGLLWPQSGTTSTNRNQIHLGATATTLPLIANQIEYFAWLIYFPNITTMQLKFGLGTDIGSATTGQLGTSGVFWSFDPAVSSTLQFITRNASTSSPRDTATVNLNSWYLCEAFFDGTTWTPRVNDQGYAGLSTNVPGAVAHNMGLQIQTLTNAARSVIIDYFAMVTREMGVRY